MWRVEYISTAVSNKLQAWVWHSPSRRRKQMQLCPINCRLGLAQPQLQKRARCSTAVFPKMFMFREKQSQVHLVPENYHVMPPPPRAAAPPHFATVSVEHLHPSAQSTWPQLCARLVFCLLSFLHLLSPNPS
jgi:hypothetical protein